MSIQQQIYRTFTKTHGLTLRAESTQFIQAVLTELRISPLEIPEWLNAVAVLWLKREVDSTLVELEPLKTIVSAKLQTHQVAVIEPHAVDPDLNATSAAATDSGLDSDLGFELDSRPQRGLADVDIRDHFHIIDAFQVPRWKYDSLRKVFVKYENPPRLLGGADTKAEIHQDRYDLIRQRLLRNEHFVASSFGGDDSDRYCRLDTIEALQGRDGASFMLFGMLSQLEEGVLSLEDPHRSVRLDLSLITAQNQSRGLFTENAFVLAEGIYEDGVFKVEAIGQPPPEPAATTRSHFTKTNFFGGPPEVQDATVLQQIQDEFAEASIVVLSDVWLDSPAVLDKLRTMFRGFEATSIPLAFVLMGNFSSEPFIMAGQAGARYKALFDRLAALISGFKRLAQTSYFVFVPGPNDPWTTDLLPRPRIPDFFTAGLRQRLPRCVMASNPCRIKYCNRELVFFRQDLMGKLRRNCVLTPSDAVVGEEAAESGGSQDVKRHLVRTLLDQAHLCPLPLRVSPVYWAHDHALRLYPIPDLLVLADKYDSYAVDYEECCSLNPGSFATNDFGFYVYYPARGLAQYSAIPK
ncbi:DNA-directed DNA polymerase epsilon, subunit B [Tieghemiomyces parasiticus]|uniref:DNA polymerase epsilon subunit n=1 Tax=Tieghemiomyces parasiticus TaxID=78921 RepID=A0A9W8E1H1_9FUNG|nr:DNA-directed DNA polymerase epsilon, subunit B [Tieghemiomyces parasiticus]